MSGMRVGGQLLEEGHKRLLDERAERIKALSTGMSWFDAYQAAYKALKPRLEGRHAAMVGNEDPTLEPDGENSNS